LLMLRPPPRPPLSPYTTLFRSAGHGIDIRIMQSNVSRSVRGVLRGLHYQWPRPQGKLVQVLEGEVYDVAVDIRRGSPTFGQWTRSEEHTSELQSRENLVCRLLL